MKNIEFILNDHFAEFVEDWDHKIYLLVGGYGSSKSYHVAVKLIRKLLQEKRKALVVREVYDTIRDSCYDLAAIFEAYLHRTGGKCQITIYSHCFCYFFQ